MDKNITNDVNSSFGFFFMAVYTFLILIRPHEWPVFSIDFPILRTFLIITFLMYLFLVRPKIWNEQTWLLCAFILIILISEFRNLRFFSNSQVVTDSIYNILVPFILYTGYVNTYFRQKLLLNISILACLIMSLHSYFQINDLNGVGWASRAIPRSDSEKFQARYVGIFNDPNDLGMFLVMNIPISIHLMVQTNSFAKKSFYFISCLCIFMCIYWTNSRGSLVGAIAVLFAFFYINYGKFKSILLSVVSLPVLLVIMTKFRSLSADDESSKARIDAWYQGILMFKSHPFLGVGKDQFIENHYRTAHNSFVLVFSELGFLGYVIWTSFILSIFYLLFCILKLDNSKSLNKELFDKEKHLTLYLVISLIGFCVTAFFISRAYILIFYIYAAMCVAVYYRTCKIHPDLPITTPPGTLLKVMGVCTVSLIFLYLIILSLL